MDMVAFGCQQHPKTCRQVGETLSGLESATAAQHCFALAVDEAIGCDTDDCFPQKVPDVAGNFLNGFLLVASLYVLDGLALASLSM